MIHRSKPLALLAALALVTAAALLGVARSSSEPAQAAVQAVPVPAVTKLPSISGTAREGERLRADRGQWTNNPTSYAFRWQRCNTAGRSCNNISGATSSTYLLTARDVGRRIRVVVTARNAGGASSAASAPTDVVTRRGPPPANTSAPVVSGDAEVGKTLTVSNGTWTNGPTVFRYQWQRCNPDGTGCANIPGETRNARIMAPDDAGKRLRSLVTALNAFGSAQAASTLSEVVVALPAGAIRLPNGQLSIPVSSVSLPERLIIDRVSFSPNPVRSRGRAIVARFRVVDTRGNAVRETLVFARSTPIVTSTPPESLTDQAGWATLRFVPRASFPLRNRGAVQFFVRARKPGENVLAGISTRRLVQVRTARPR